MIDKDIKLEDFPREMICSYSFTRACGDNTVLFKTQCGRWVQLSADINNRRDAKFCMYCGGIVRESEIQA